MNLRLRQNGPTYLLLLFLLAITSIATYLQLREESTYPSLSTLSNEPQGARALLQWLEALDYAASNTVQSSYQLPDASNMVVVLEPQSPGIGEEQWESLDDWVASGGVLYLIGEGFGASASMQYWGTRVLYREGLEGPINIEARDAGWITPERFVHLQPRAVLQEPEGEHERLITIDGESLAVKIRHGDGIVILSTLTHPFTNRGLKETGNGEFVLSMLALADERRSIWFDEWHHGLRAGPDAVVRGPEQWLRHSRPGQAILYTAIVSFVWLVISGIRFGKPIPLKSTGQRRAPAEHARALAGLSKRAGHVFAVRDYFHRELKRQVGTRYGLPPALPDDAFVQKLSQIRPELDHRHLAKILETLRQERIKEDELLILAQEIDEWLKR